MRNQKYNYTVDEAMEEHKKKHCTTNISIGAGKDFLVFHKRAYELYADDFRLEGAHCLERDADPEVLWLFMPFHLLNSNLKILF